MFWMDLGQDVMVMVMVTGGIRKTLEWNLSGEGVEKAKDRIIYSSIIHWP